MPHLKHLPPSLLSAIITISHLLLITLSHLLASFRLGAHDAYDPSVILILDSSGRFLGKSPREVREGLDEEEEGGDGDGGGNGGNGSRGRGRGAFLVVDEGSRDGGSG